MPPLFLLKRSPWPKNNKIRQWPISWASAEAAGQTKGRVGGPARHVDSVNPGSTDVYEIRFRGSERAMIGAKSRNGEDIDIVVLDENHNEICKDYDNDGVPVCSWTPKWTGQFYIKIKNRTNGPVRYELITS
jgi:hypothetical protein